MSLNLDIFGTIINSAKSYILVQVLKGYRFNLNSKFEHTLRTREFYHLFINRFGNIGDFTAHSNVGIVNKT